MNSIYTTCGSLFFFFLITVHQTASALTGCQFLVREVRPLTSSQVFSRPDSLAYMFLKT